MKETPLCNVEKGFLFEALLKKKRIDGRGLMERRPITIQFGSEYGTCLTVLGQTRVLASVSCTVGEPRPTRPSEGIFMVSFEFSGMSCPKYCDSWFNQDEESIEISRLVERSLKESKCLDMESLCIVAEEKVWCVRLSIKVLNHDGGVADCASVAGLSALAHARRPEVTIQGDSLTIHPPSERDPVPLSIHHYPVFSTFGFFKVDSDDRIIILDPHYKEEACLDGKLVLGMNPYREICTLHLAGQVPIDKDSVLRLSHFAVEHAKNVLSEIKLQLAKDEEARVKGDTVGMAMPAHGSASSNILIVTDESR